MQQSEEDQNIQDLTATLQDQMTQIEDARNAKISRKKAELEKLKSEKNEAMKGLEAEIQQLRD